MDGQNPNNINNNLNNGIQNNPTLNEGNQIPTLDNGINSNLQNNLNTNGLSQNTAINNELNNLNQNTVLDINQSSSVESLDSGLNQTIQNNNLNSVQNGAVESLSSDLNQNLQNNVVSNEPVLQVIPGTENEYQASSLTNDTVGVGAQTLGTLNVNSNGFVEPNKVENIGMVPPSNNSSNKKKKISKPLFVIIIILLICLVAFGVYYFLKISSVKVTLKDVKLNLGDTLSDNINDYATISGGKKDSCSLVLPDVNSNEIGEYEYKIVCDNKTFTGKITVSDINAPSVFLKPVYKEINSNIDANDFIESCEDISDCNVSFKDSDIVEGYLTSAGGPYKIDLTVSDKYNNSVNVEGELYVSSSEIRYYTSCSSKATELNNYNATKTVTDLLPLGYVDAGLSYIGFSRRIYTYVFNDKDEYNEVVKDKNYLISFDNISGLAFYDDKNLTLKISTDLSLDTLNNDFGGTFPIAYSSFNTYYKDLGYSCSNSSAQ